MINYCVSGYLKLQKGIKVFVDMGVGNMVSAVAKQWKYQSHIL